MTTPQQLLQDYFGFAQFRPGQETTIERILAGQHTLLVMPTGSGKSLAYQLPALLLPGLTLVISPLIALMKDQVDGLVERGIQATYINSSLPTAEVNRRTRAVLEGHVKLLYIAPERLRNRQFCRTLARARVSLLVVDEAHCISQWGHDFRPDYLQIGPTWQALGSPPLLATTATATKTVQQDIIELLAVPHSRTIVTGFNRPNLTFEVHLLPDPTLKLQRLQELLAAQPGPVIIYTATRRGCEEVTDFIQRVLNRPAQAYHAGLDYQARYQVQTEFMAGRLPTVVATNAFGMGVDKADVRAVIHYNMPTTVEAYYQEAGRAGRDGLPAQCALFFSPDDLRLQERIINSDTPTTPELHQIYHRLAQSAHDGEVYFTIDELAELTGLHPVKVRVILSELETAGAILSLGDERGYRHWRVLPLASSALPERGRAIAQRAKTRLERLQLMVDYAQLTSCRREFLLNYFGDLSPVETAHCCDNHNRPGISALPRATTPQEWYPLIVLETVRSLQQRPVGRNRLVQLLSGSQARAMQQYGYDRHKFYGKLQALTQTQLSELLAALLAANYLQVSGGELPVLLVSPLGLEALAARAALPVALPGQASPETTAEPRSSSPERSDTVSQTYALFSQGLTVAEIAARRELAESTIYAHLARLIAGQKIKLAQVVGPEIEAQVLAAVAQLGRSTALTPLKAILPPEISYEAIRCVLAAQPDATTRPARPVPGPPDSGPPAAEPAEPLSPVTLILEQAILTVVADLAGLLTPAGLASLLTAGPDEVVSFSDHDLCGLFHEKITREELEGQIEALIRAKQLVLSPHQRLILP